VKEFDELIDLVGRASFVLAFVSYRVQETPIHLGDNVNNVIAPAELKKFHQLNSRRLQHEGELLAPHHTEKEVAMLIPIYICEAGQAVGWRFIRKIRENVKGIDVFKPEVQGS
jgi:hypothetical protein